MKTRLTPETIAEIAALEGIEHTGPLPIRGLSGVVFRGVNALILSRVARERGYDDLRWYTFADANLVGEQAARASGRSTVKHKGVWCFEDTGRSCGGIRKGQNKANACGGTQVTLVDRQGSIIGGFTVFNAAQLDYHLRQHLDEAEAA